MKFLEIPVKAREILEVYEDVPFRMKDGRNINGKELSLIMFEQTWGNTSGGFETWGGCALTTQTTYVVLFEDKEEYAQVFFGGKFAYRLIPNELFLKDLADKNIAGLSEYKKKYNI